MGALRADRLLDDGRLGVEAQRQAEPASTDPIDRAHLVRYTLGDVKLEREILGLFVAQLPLTLESLSFAETDRDWQMAAHTLKGSGRAVGAWKVARMAQAAEKVAGASDPDQRRAVLAAIEAAVAEVEAYVAEAFPPQPE